MLSTSGMNMWFYYIRNFTDMRCKYSRILAVIRHQLGKKLERDKVFIVISQNWRLIRLLSFDRISFSLYEKRFAPEYQFMKVVIYMDHLWDEVLLYRKDESYLIDNNLSERSVKPFATKRKCLRYVGCDEGS